MRQKMTKNDFVVFNLRAQYVNTRDSYYRPVTFEEVKRLCEGDRLHSGKPTKGNVKYEDEIVEFCQQLIVLAEDNHQVVVQINTFSLSGYGEGEDGYGAVDYTQSSEEIAISLD